MHNGFEITFHEVIPELGLLELVVTELDKLGDQPGLYCSVVVSQTHATPQSFDILVALLPRERHPRLTGYAVDGDPYYALRLAFAALRDACDADLSREQPRSRAGRAG
jgi:hypothetical protein